MREERWRDTVDFCQGQRRRGSGPSREFNPVLICSSSFLMVLDVFSDVVELQDSIKADTDVLFRIHIDER